MSSPPSHGGGGGGGTALTRRRSVFVHGTATTTAAAATPPTSVNMGRRNTVVGGGPVDCGPPPTPLSLRDIYQLSRRRGSFHNRRHTVYCRRLSTFAVLHHDRDAAAGATRAGAGGLVARVESGRSRRPPACKQLSVDSALRSDVDTAALDVLRRRSDVTEVERKQSLMAKDQSLGSDKVSPVSRRSEDNATRDTTKTRNVDIILVSWYFCDNYVSLLINAYGYVIM